MSNRVLVVGGGLAGLSTAAFLAWHGVAVTLVERHTGALRHPRARAVNNRTMEVYRGIGLEPAVRAHKSHAADPGALLLRVDTLAGKEIWRREAVAPAGPGSASPCGWASIDQDELEEVLQRRASELGADIRFGTALRTLDVRDDGVTALVEDGTGRYEIAARYVVAADGHRSGIRRRLGIEPDGPGVLGETFTFLFVADLREALAGRTISVVHIEHPRPGTVLLPHDGDRQWVFSAPYEPDVDGPPEEFTEEYCAGLVRAAIGVPDLDVRVVPQMADGTTILTYQLGGRVAPRFREGPVFLVGDAAHQVPPTGAFGASTGVQDTHNLAWKLAMVLRGEAGPSLLDTYDTERRPVAWFTLEQALLQLRDRTGRDVLGSGAKPAEYDSVVFGYRYGPGEALPPEELRGQIGTRAPHLTVTRDGTELSTVDLYGPRFVLVTTDGEVARPLEKEYPLDVYELGADIHAPDYLAVHELPDGGAILVRPDGFVAWRGAASASDLRAVLDEALHRR
jgi:2-polyprenyl-6-methoxyphenol hydroxylase-like FAD-dependent oxidoreductase